jgi:hypothetical protein
MEEHEVLAANTAAATSINTAIPSIEMSFSDKVAAATEDLWPNCFDHLHHDGGEPNALTICNYIFSLRSEINPAYNYRKGITTVLCSLSMFFKNAESFKEITREDLLSFLNSRRKPEDVDPLHKWIGTYNLYRMQSIRFFKWLYFPDIEPYKRPKPPVIENIPQLKRKVNA